MAQDTRAPGRAQRAPQAPQLARVFSGPQEGGVGVGETVGGANRCPAAESPGIPAERTGIPPETLPSPLPPPSRAGSYRGRPLHPESAKASAARKTTTEKTRSAYSHRGSGRRRSAPRYGGYRRYQSRVQESSSSVLARYGVDPSLENITEKLADFAQLFNLTVPVNLGGFAITLRFDRFLVSLFLESAESRHYFLMLFLRYMECLCRFTA